ncbi:UNVERIFIED_CONTAM: hypothetical protein FKN15_001780 [Acipenser sinensis]
MAFTLSEIMAARRQQHGGRVTVDVDEHSANPTQAFTFYNINQGRFQPPHVHMVDPLPHDAPKPPGYTRFVCISDTHSRTDAIQMPYGDVFIHAGDFTELGLPSEVKKFNDWLGFLDWVPKKMQRVGCMELLNTVQKRVQPKLHVFGHIHEGSRSVTPAYTTKTGRTVKPPEYLKEFKLFKK